MDYGPFGHVYLELREEIHGISKEITRIIDLEVGMDPTNKKAVFKLTHKIAETIEILRNVNTLSDGSNISWDPGPGYRKLLKQGGDT
jgi:hypothetical protein